MKDGDSSVRRSSLIRTVKEAGFFAISTIFGLAVLPFLSGCNTPFWATDNEFFLRLPGTERRSDRVEGVLRPWERLERIDEKGEEGADASPEEKKILAYQLIEEYHRSNDPIIRRASIQALGKITENAHLGPALQTLTEALREPNLGNRIAACNALGRYGSKMKTKEIAEIRRGIVAVYADCYRGLSYSANAGAQKENNERKDFRLAILRNAALFDDSPEVIDLLAEALDGEKLDDGALRLGAMTALGQVTKKNYGADYALWSQYVAYRQGDADHMPKEKSSFGTAFRLDDMSILK